jgi:hypothetical protein
MNLKIFQAFLCVLSSATLLGCALPPSSARQPSGVVSQSFVRSPPDKIAIVVEKSIGTRYSPRDVEDTITIGLMRKNYTVASRSDVDTITKEMGFQQSGLTDKDATKIGRCLTYLRL